VVILEWQVGWLLGSHELDVSDMEPVFLLPVLRDGELTLTETGYSE
jgi:hypothetical protein